MLKRVLLVLFIAAIILPSWPSMSGAGLHSSVRKYQGTEVTYHSVQKLKKFDEIIRYFCNFSYFVPHHTVSPDFIRALILAESGANPRALSSKGARGLGQIMYGTGKEAARDLSKSTTHFRYVSKKKLKSLTAEDLYDPAINILLTCYLIAKYNYRFDGKLHLVVSAWNAGEYTNSLALGKHAPYKETEDLIGKVNAFYLFLLKNRLFH